MSDNKVRGAAALARDGQPTPAMVARRIQPGQALNPGGRPKGIEAALRERYKDDIPAMHDAMRDIILGRLPPGIGVESSVRVKDRIAAYNSFMDRMYGKARVHIDHTTNESTRHDVDIDTLDEGQLARVEAFFEGLARETQARDLIEAPQTSAPAIVVQPGHMIDVVPEKHDDDV